MRTEKGTFAAGNPGGPGRPPKSVEADYQDAVRRAVTGDDLAAVLRSITGKAKRGDVQAAKLLLAYTVGLPTDSSTADRLTKLEALANELSQARQN